MISIKGTKAPDISVYNIVHKDEYFNPKFVITDETSLIPPTKSSFNTYVLDYTFTIESNIITNSGHKITGNVTIFNPPNELITALGVNSFNAPVKSALVDKQSTSNIAQLNQVYKGTITNVLEYSVPIIKVSNPFVGISEVFVSTGATFNHKNQTITIPCIKFFMAFFNNVVAVNIDKNVKKSTTMKEALNLFSKLLDLPIAYFGEKYAIPNTATGEIATFQNKSYLAKAPLDSFSDFCMDNDLVYSYNDKAIDIRDSDISKTNDTSTQGWFFAYNQLTILSYGQKNNFANLTLTCRLLPVKLFDVVFIQYDPQLTAGFNYSTYIISQSPTITPEGSKPKVMSDGYLEANLKSGLNNNFIKYSFIKSSTPSDVIDNKITYNLIKAYVIAYTYYSGYDNEYMELTVTTNYEFKTFNVNKLVASVGTIAELKKITAQ